MSARPMPTGFGSFCWQQLNTTDLSAAEAFYMKLFGWESKREANAEMAQWGPFAVLKNQGHEIATIMQMPTDAGSQSHWLSYVWVKDIEAGFAKMQALGGKTFVPPRTIPEGRFAVFADPSGALLAMFEKASPMDTAKPAASGPGTFCWFECTTREGEACIAFYTAPVRMDHVELGHGARGNVHHLPQWRRAGRRPHAHEGPRMARRHACPLDALRFSQQRRRNVRPR